jgi:mRNA interferase RelE/StbE
VANYAIDIRPRARRSLNQLDPAIRRAVARTIDALSTDPQPVGAILLKGHRPYLRVRSGDYRVIYTDDDQACVVTVAAIGHRREIYGRLVL